MAWGLGLQLGTDPGNCAQKSAPGHMAMLLSHSVASVLAVKDGG